MQHFIGAYGYLAIFILMLAESACIPVPSELTMPLGGALAAGAVPGVHLTLALVIVVGVAGNLAGSYLAWAVGRYGGQRAWRRLSRFTLGGADGLQRAQHWFDRYGGRAVFAGRLLPVVRTFISLPAGFARMAPLRFWRLYRGRMRPVDRRSGLGRLGCRGQLASRYRPGSECWLCDRRAGCAAGHRRCHPYRPGAPPGGLPRGYEIMPQCL